MGRTRIRCTVGERILLHLHSYNKYIDQWEVPYAQTQDGIARHIGVMRSAVAREIGKLRPDGLVEETSKHVLGGKRKRKVYFLTEAGTAAATEIDQRLRDSIVILHDDRGVHQIKLDEICPETELELTIPELMQFVHSSGKFDLASAQAFTIHPQSDDDPDEEGPSQTEGLTDLRSLEYSDKVPTIKVFYGRQNEMSTIQEHIDDPDCKFVVVQGLAGMGKTTLAAKIAQNNRDRKHIFWYTFGRWNSFRNIMIPFSEFMKRLDKPTLSAYLRTGEDFEYQAFFDLLAKDAQGLQILLVVDNYHRAEERSKNFFSLLVDALEWVHGSTILVLSRDQPEFYNRGHVKVKGIVGELKLEGLDETSVIEMLGSKDLADTDISAIYDATRGHPLALELIETPTDVESQGDVHRFIEEEILRDMSDQEETLLQIASVFRYPVEAQAFFKCQEIEDHPQHFDELDHGLVTGLVGKTLFNQYQDLTYDVHDFVREFFYSRLTPKDRKQFHQFAARYYEELGDERSIIETMHHLLKAGETQEAAGLALDEGPGLIYKGYVEFSNILEQLPSDGSNIELFEELQDLREDARLRMRGVEFEGLLDV